MSKGHVFLAQNSTTDYVTQAYALAVTIKKHNRVNQTCIITNDQVPEEYKHAFDYIVGIPWDDTAKDKQWKIENRWKIIHATPFKENLVYDTDMLLLNSNDYWWNSLSNYNLALTGKVYTYKGTVIENDYYRKTFTTNNLPNVYMGVHYFKKTQTAFEFYKWLEIITNNYQQFYKEFLPNFPQKFCSMDVNSALAIKFLGIEHVTNNIMSFTHMKPAIQGWSKSYAKWKDVVGHYITEDKKLNIGNFNQTGVFHYTEDDFLTNDILDILANG